ncbi:MAG: di-trans,poly-cis-decaprenylcistransferase [Candidatus Eremiobacteraeota bacterium]|nr:di-trans,poly-cis-decaprenylcistransferase [Candidatus Eremiobacteraeota bacterium]MBV9699023.1 di-trans,poly-cis-decaprenylcistransferase [Candidatus Eremiobacteraeota bacterium]
MTPHHVAVIMDGNRRWARERNLPIAEGYQRGITALRRTLRAARAAGIPVVTAFAFSDENWSRPAVEVSLIMALCLQAARGELRALAGEGVRVRLCGRTDRLPTPTRHALDELVARTTANRAITLNLAVDYGARREIRDAVRALVREVKAGVRDVESIDDGAIASRLYTAGLPDPDLIIRTGGELRLSNFLLFQAAYAEFWATKTYWPDFGELELDAALRDFSVRQRRYGT